MSLSLLFWALILAAGLPFGASQTTAGSTIVGCSATTDGEPYNLWFGAISGANCWEECPTVAPRGRPYGYYYGYSIKDAASGVDENGNAPVVCYCSDHPPPMTDFVDATSGVVTVTDPDGTSVPNEVTCPDNTYLVAYLNTPFTLSQCAYRMDVPVGEPLYYSTTATFDECSQACTGYPYMAYQRAHPECMCGNAIGPQVVASTCFRDSWSFYTQDISPPVSLLRRRREAQRTLAPRPDAYCPHGEACWVAGGGYECIDTLTELESCGGCHHGSMGNSSVATGIDCTQLPGVRFNGVTCRRGRCIVSNCRQGFKLIGNSCVEK